MATISCPERPKEILEKVISCSNCEDFSKTKNWDMQETDDMPVYLKIEGKNRNKLITDTIIIVAAIIILLPILIIFTN